VLYVTRSPYLVHTARNLYYALEYANDEQAVKFSCPSRNTWPACVCRQAVRWGFHDFAQWFARHRAASRLKDPYPLFEEFQAS